MLGFILITMVLLLLSFLADRQKTSLALKKALKMFANLFFPFMTILLLVSVALSFLPQEYIVGYLGKESGVVGFLIAGLAGSISLIPGFVAYPLGAILISEGVSYPVLGVFITTLMMVGFMTLPLEARFFGWKAALMRNGYSLLAAFIIGALISLLWGIL